MIFTDISCDQGFKYFITGEVKDNRFVGIITHNGSSRKLAVTVKDAPKGGKRFTASVGSSGGKVTWTYKE